ncbi:hypothetical protein RJ55_08025 [Drechmeria coniospora]|nr:hypothetical protein RJ55_08025 [Drechmeria coniospora]
MYFKILGGGGGMAVNGIPGGRGALISGHVPVTPGQSIFAVAGGMGGTGPSELPAIINSMSPAGTSWYGDGGIGMHCSGGGGGASALYLDNVLLAVSGAGGGGNTAVSSTGDPSNPFDFTILGGTSLGNAGEIGRLIFLTYTTDRTQNISVIYGGDPGTISNPGAGGIWDGNYTLVVGGNAGTGHVGGDGVVVDNYLFAVGGGSGGGGGGYFGGGSGGSLYYDSQNNVSDRWALGGGGGGGSSFLSNNVLDPSQGLPPVIAEITPGSVIIYFD